ncbi:hypothetical protein COTS27_00306 [Spirochaetota bacterium]|nr:hypothetical protein COTS27_00306 [Spirochaetota bacterium]
MVAFDKKSESLIPKKSDLGEALHYFIEIDSLNKKGRHKKAFDDVKKAYDRLLDEILNNFTLDDLLAEAKKEEKESLAGVLLDNDKTVFSSQIPEEFNLLVKGKEYRDVLCDYAKKMKITLDGDETIIEIETTILETANKRFKDGFKKKSYEEQNELLVSINEKYRGKGNLTTETLASTGILIIVKSLGLVAATTALDALISALVQAITKKIPLVNIKMPFQGIEKKKTIISCIVIISLMRYRLKYECISKSTINEFILKKNDRDEALHFFKEVDSLNKGGRHKKAFDDAKKAYDRLLDEILNNFTLDDLLAKAKEKERKSLAEVLEVSPDDDKTGSAQRILEKFNSLVEDKEYRDVLYNYAKEMKVVLEGDETIVEIETNILKTANERFRGDFKKALREEQNKLIADINEKYEKKIGLTKEALATAGILTVNSLGFAPYLAATTTLGALSSSIGITLPFAVYTATTSFISIITGPPGWIFLSGLVLRKIRRWWRNKNRMKINELIVTNKIKITSCIFIIGLIRYRLKHERVSEATI